MNIRYGNTYELIQLSAIGTNCTRRKTSRSMGLWNKPERRFLARGFMPRKPVDRRRAERDSSGLPSGNIDLKQRKDWSIWADKMISSRGIYNRRTYADVPLLPPLENKAELPQQKVVPFRNDLLALDAALKKGGASNG